MVRAPIAAKCLPHSGRCNLLAGRLVPGLRLLRTTVHGCQAFINEPVEVASLSDGVKKTILQFANLGSTPGPWPIKRHSDALVCCFFVVSRKSGMPLALYSSCTLASDRAISSDVCQTRANKQQSATACESHDPRPDRKFW